MARALEEKVHRMGIDDKVHVLRKCRFMKLFAYSNFKMLIPVYGITYIQCHVSIWGIA